MRWREEHGLPYLFKLRQSKNVQAAIRKLEDRAATAVFSCCAKKLLNFVRLPYHLLRGSRFVVGNAVLEVGLNWTCISRSGRPPR